MSAATVAALLLVGAALLYLGRAIHRLGVQLMGEFEDITEALGAVKTDLAATRASTTKIDADVTRLLEGIPTEGGLTPAQTAALRAQVVEVKAETTTLAEAAALIDQRVPDPPV